MNIEMFTLHISQSDTSVLIKVQDVAGVKVIVAARMERNGLAPSIMVHVWGRMQGCIRLMTPCCRQSLLDFELGNFILFHVYSNGPYL